MLNNKIFLWVKKNIFELISFITFCAITVFISFFHELWFDELQALAISKDNIYNILFVIPHYEGHSPLWYLILKFFNYFIKNPDIILKGVNLSIMYTAIWLLIFKSPFPKEIRCILPFTFFLLYQYSINSRPYSIMILSLFCAAIFYKKRDTKQLGFILSLALMALSGAYGVVMCTCICIEWGINIIFVQKQNIKNFLKHDKRFYGMSFLFFLCFAMLCIMIPLQDTRYYTGLKMLPELHKQLYFLFGLTADTTISNIYNYNTRHISNLFTPYNIASLVLGAIILFITTKIFIQNKKFTMFFITYFGVLFFLDMFYIQPHHVGVPFLFLIYLFWCLMNDTKTKIVFPIYFKVLLILIFSVQIYWSCYSCTKEISYDYSATNEVIKFLKENKLDDGYNIIINTRWLAAQINAYYDKNMDYSFNVSNHDKLYAVHKIPSLEDKKAFDQKIKRTGTPDIYIYSTKCSEKNLKYLRKNLKIAKIITAGWIFKESLYDEKTKILIKKELYKKIRKNNNNQPYQ